MLTHPNPELVVKKNQLVGDDFEAELLKKNPDRSITNENIIVSEEATESGLRLRPVDIKFSVALQKLHTVTKDYAYAPMEVVFNWDEVVEELGLDEEGDWFVVVFRSIRNEDADAKLLYEADHLAHEEAKKSGGLLKYWYGDLNHHRECLAMCIWANYEFAKLATTKPLHLKAVRLASRMYKSYLLERYSIVKHRNEKYLHIRRL